MSISRSPSRSRSSSRGREDRSRSRSSSRGSVYHMSASRSRSRTPSIERRDRSRSPDSVVPNKTTQQPRYVQEMTRGKSKRTSEGKLKGFGSFYRRKPGNYSEAEFVARPGSKDRIRTADCTLGDQAERALADDDSLQPSDWADRTSIDPVQYAARKAAELEFADRRAASKRVKTERGY